MGRKSGIRAATAKVVACLLPSLLAAVAGCGPSPQEKLIRDACLALKAQDWEAFERLTITEADYVLRENRIADTEIAGTFAGSTLRPQQRERLHEQYDRAVRGGEGQLDFSRCRYVFPALAGERTLRTLTGAPIPLQEFRVEIEMDGPERTAPGLDPVFVLAAWDGGYRIFEMRFQDRR